MSDVKERLKTTVGPQWQARARALSRLRWLAKYRLMRRAGERLRDHPRRNLAYVLWDPELESHTYDVANLDELADFLASELGVEHERALGYLREPESDPVFNEEWRRRMRFRFDVKHRAQLANRLIWWGLVRCLRPRLVVECGIFNGVGSLVLLRALERNRAEGSPGELISIDSDPTMGWAVPSQLEEHWTTVEGFTSDVLEGAIAGREVGMLIHDTPHTYENQVLEFSAALRHPAERLVLIDSSGGQTPALEEICEREGGRYRYFRELPKDHFYPGNGSGIGIFDRRGAQRGERAAATAEAGSDSTV
jgi:methyltransferase family protein